MLFAKKSLNLRWNRRTGLFRRAKTWSWEPSRLAIWAKSKAVLPELRAANRNEGPRIFGGWAALVDVIHIALNSTCWYPLEIKHGLLENNPFLHAFFPFKPPFVGDFQLHIWLLEGMSSPPSNFITWFGLDILCNTKPFLRFGTSFYSLQLF